MATTTWQKVLANVATIALLVGLSGARATNAAQKVSMIGVVDNTDAIAGCSLSIDTAAKMATPLVTMQPPARTTAIDIRFTLFDAAGTLVETHDVSVPPPTFGPALMPFSYNANFAKAHCDLKPVEAPADAASASPSGGGGGGGGSGALIVVGALAAVGVVAVAAGSSGHGSGGSSSSPTNPPFTTPTPVQTTPTPVSGTPTATPRLTATPTPKASSSPGAPTATPTAVATATPTARATASPTPGATTGPLTLTPSSLTFASTGASQNQSSTASEAGYSGSFSATAGSCGGIATISNSSGGTFTVTPAGAGSCSFTISSTNGKSAQLAITVTITSGVIETRRHLQNPRPRK